MNDLAQEVISILTELRVFDYSDDVVESVKNGDKPDFDNEFIHIIQETCTQTSVINNLIKKLIKARNSDEQNIFWDSFTGAGYSPAYFLPLCAGLIDIDGTPRQSGLELYAVLLGMEPLSILWNSTIFNTMLSFLITAAQAIEGRRPLTDEQQICIDLSILLFPHFSKIVTIDFQRLAGLDSVIALIELSFKLSVAIDKDYERFASHLTVIILEFLNSIVLSHLDYIAPYLVSNLILEYLPSSKTITLRVQNIRKGFIELAKRYNADQSLLLQMIKHIIVRTSDRISYRENTTFVVKSLAPFLDDRRDLFTFIEKLTKSTRVSQRTIAMDLIGTFLTVDFIPFEQAVTFAKSAFRSIKDCAPQVRSAAIDSLSVICDTNVISEVSTLDDLLTQLSHRIVDEKLTVRKSALRCIDSVMKVKPLPAGYPLIADRTHDRSPSLRQEAIRMLSKFLTVTNASLIILWFDSILPMTLDQDSRTQELALNLFNDHFLSHISDKTGEKMAVCLNAVHIEMLSKVFPIYKQRSISLQKVCNSIQRSLSIESIPQYWQIALSLINVVPSFFKSKPFFELWEQRSELPVEYFTIISKLNVEKHPEVRADSLRLLNMIADGLRPKITGALFGVIHASITILSKFDSPDVNDLIQKLTTVINMVGDRDFSGEFKKLIAPVYLLGECLTIIPQLNDVNFTGLKLLIGDRLPNEREIPSSLQAMATITLGKLCMLDRDVSRSFVAAFANRLRDSTDPTLKCNCLIVLCDLNVKYTATVDQYINHMSECFADSSPVVRRQALLIMTRLIAEDFVKMKPLLFFRFVHSIVDRNSEISGFAQSCLFNVLSVKDPKLLSYHFIDALCYFNDQLDLTSLNEDEAYHEKFMLHDIEKRHAAYSMMIKHMTNAILFDLLQASCMKILQTYLNNEHDLEEGEGLLADTFFVMLEIEEEMEAVNVTEANTEDPRSEKVAEQARVYISLIHSQLIKRVLPILNQMHAFLRAKFSPLQKDLRMFYRKLVEKHPSILDELSRQEPLLASELQQQIALAPTPTEALISQPSSPRLGRPEFRSPLLSKLARTPQFNLLTSPAHGVLSNRLEGLRPEIEEEEKERPPIPFDLDE